jgi:VCBS repeat-containing protein
MNRRIVVAEAGNSPVLSPVLPHVVYVVKPQSDHAITLELSNEHAAKLDLSSVANEHLTLVHVGTKLVILFDNQSSVTVDPFFDAAGTPFTDLDVELGAGRGEVNGEQFAALFPITEYQTVLPAAGNGVASGGDFHSQTETAITAVDPLGTGNPLALLGQEELPNFIVDHRVFASNLSAALPATIHTMDSPPNGSAPNPPLLDSGVGQLAANQFTSTTGHVGTGGGAIAGVAAGDTNADLVNAATVDVAVHGKYGTLTLHPDGSYSYVRDAGSAGGVDDVFTYTVRGADGGVAHATLTMALGDSAPTVTIPDAGLPTTTVSESGLTDGSHAAGASATTAGTMAFTSPDGVQQVSLGGHVLSSTPQTFTDAAGSLTASYVYDANTSQGTINYSYTLAHNTSGDASSISLAVSVTDSDGDVTPAGNLNIAVVDDAPVAVADTVSSVVTGATTLTGLLANDKFGADGVDTTTPGQVTVTNGTHGTVAYNNDGTFTYTPTDVYTGSDSFTYTIKDSDGDTSTATVTLSVHSVPNVAPVNTVPGAQSVNEDSNLVFSGGNAISVGDADAKGGNEQVTLDVGHGTLNLSTIDGLTVTGDGTGHVVITGDLSHIDAALNGLTYRGAQDYNGSDTLRITTNDLGNGGVGGALSDTDSIALNVTPVNDAPVNGVPGAQSTNEDQALVFSAGNGNAITVSDVDAGTGRETVTLSVHHGMLTLCPTSGLSLSGNHSDKVTLTGTVDQINAALAELKYVPADDFHGSDVLTITTHDKGHSGTGGALSDTDIVAINVAPIDHAPTAGADVIYVAGTTDVVLPGSVLTANDSDPEGDPLHITSVGDITGIGGNPIATHVSGDGDISFTPPVVNDDADGAFSYGVSDGEKSSIGTVSVHQIAVNTNEDHSDFIYLPFKDYQYAFIDTGDGDDGIFLGTGIDHIVGGVGADVFFVADSFNLNAGDSINGTQEASTIDKLVLDDAATYDLTKFDITNIDELELSSSVQGDFVVTVGDAMVSTADYNQDGIGGDLEIRTSSEDDNTAIIDASGLTGSNSIMIEGNSFNGDDLFKGGAGADFIEGGDGNDTLIGNGGNDTLVGGNGADTLNGGGGADHFLFNEPSEGGDHIVDFEHGADSIDVLLAAFTGLSGTGAVAASDFVTSNNAATANIGSSHFAYNQSTGQLYYDSNGGSASDGSRVLLAVLDNHAALAATDIHKV